MSFFKNLLKLHGNKHDMHIIVCFPIRSHTADTIGLWEDLHQSNDELNLKSAIEKFTLHPFKATEGYHIESLPVLVQIHREKKLPMRYSVKFVLDRKSDDYKNKANIYS